jgi:hypothetical protein
LPSWARDGDDDDDDEHFSPIKAGRKGKGSGKSAGLSKVMAEKD